ncbi:MULTISPECIES: hypothetical protein [unclassified Dehalobacter]|uniref:hypothetical protein n=1 Tax=unclassified Dehalobacter TaxID=2635733 RepID=UPI000E6C9D89|nr:MULTISPECIES: hypothetical protein [unclassified Dehalobacter]RJE48806.1 hypothetical protein A7K50_08620 [Dehalobacter sp. MCB1]TCX51898.1 hypothetical protein C1I36_06145 [Dehalobacter sp. 14DCB1]TCX52958.1 hypothetical protein C1I38_07825 [Dehalobacter sp. 12DCB1]
MRITILPKSKSGKKSFILVIVSWILFVVGSVLPYKEGYSGLELILNNPLQVVITVLIFAAGIAAAIIGMKAVIRNKERSILVFLVILIGVYYILSFCGVAVNVFFS